MTIYDLKPRFQNLLRPICRWLADKGVTANSVTISAIVLSMMGGLLVYFARLSTMFLWAIPIILFIRMALNAIDGMLAREHNMTSATGAILNEMGDVLSDVVLYLPFAYLVGVSTEFIVILVVLSIFVEMIGVVSVQIGASRRYDGPFGKSDRAFLFGLIAVLLASGLTAGWWLHVLLLVCIALSVWTIFKRSSHALAEINDT